MPVGATYSYAYRPVDSITSAPHVNGMLHAPFRLGPAFRMEDKGRAIDAR